MEKQFLLNPRRERHCHTLDHVVMTNGLENTEKNINSEEKQILEYFKLAVIKGNLDEINLSLVKGNIYVDETLSGGWSALMIASSMGHFHIVKYLLHKRADPNCYKGHCNPLICACASRKEEDNLLKCAELLLQYGADVNTHDRYHLTPLMFSCKERHKKLVKLLLPLANVNSQDLHKWTALFWAVNENDIEIVEMLLKHGVTLNIKDRRGNTPLDLAISKRFTEIAILLRLYMYDKVKENGRIHVIKDTKQELMNRKRRLAVLCLKESRQITDTSQKSTSEKAEFHTESQMVPIKSEAFSSKRTKIDEAEEIIRKLGTNGYGYHVSHINKVLYENTTENEKVNLTCEDEEHKNTENLNRYEENKFQQKSEGNNESSTEIIETGKLQTSCEKEKLSKNIETFSRNMLTENLRMSHENKETDFPKEKSLLVNTSDTVKENVLQSEETKLLYTSERNKERIPVTEDARIFEMSHENKNKEIQSEEKYMLQTPNVNKENKYSNENREMLQLLLENKEMLLKNRETEDLQVLHENEQSSKEEEIHRFLSSNENKEKALLKEETKLQQIIRENTETQCKKGDIDISHLSHESKSFLLIGEQKAILKTAEVKTENLFQDAENEMLQREEKNVKQMCQNEGNVLLQTSHPIQEEISKKQEDQIQQTLNEREENITQCKDRIVMNMIYENESHNFQNEENNIFQQLPEINEKVTQSILCNKLQTSHESKENLTQSKETKINNTSEKIKKHKSLSEENKMLELAHEIKETLSQDEENDVIQTSLKNEIHNPQNAKIQITLHDNEKAELEKEMTENRNILHYEKQPKFHDTKINILDNLKENKYKLFQNEENILKKICEINIHGNKEQIVKDEEIKFLQDKSNKKLHENKEKRFQQILQGNEERLAVEERQAIQNLLKNEQKSCEKAGIEIIETSKINNERTLKDVCRKMFKIPEENSDILCNKKEWDLRKKLEKTEEYIYKEEEKEAVHVSVESVKEKLEKKETKWLQKLYENTAMFFGNGKTKIPKILYENKEHVSEQKKIEMQQSLNKNEESVSEKFENKILPFSNEEIVLLQKGKKVFHSSHENKKHMSQNDERNVILIFTLDDCELIMKKLNQELESAYERISYIRHKLQRNPISLPQEKKATQCILLRIRAEENCERSAIMYKELKELARTMRKANSKVDVFPRNLLDENAMSNFIKNWTTIILCVVVTGISVWKCYLHPGS